MHGTILFSLTEYVEGKFGKNCWAQVLTKAGLEGHFYFPVSEYPDSEAAALFDAVVALTGRPAAALLQDFGAHLVPMLLKMYGSLVEPEWKTLDLIEHTEATIHKVVRMANPGARPPQLRCSRPSANEVVVTYNSPRRLCSLAIGISKGLASHYHEQIVIEETKCMHRGDDACVISIKRVV